MLLMLLSEYLPYGIMVCAFPGGSWKYETVWAFLLNAGVCALIAGVLALTVRHVLGEHPTNLARLKAVAAEIVLAYILYAMT